MLANVRPALVVGIASLVACARPGPVLPPVPAYDYVLSPPAAGTWMVHVEARFDGAPGERLVGPGTTRPAAVRLVSDGAERILSPAADGSWSAAECRRSCTLRYDLDLSAVVDACRGFACPRRVGDAILGPADMWMLHPDALGDGTFHVRVAGADADRLATGLRRDPAGGYRFRGHELGEAAYTAFGAFRRARVDVPGGSLDVALLGAPIAMGDAGVLAWIRNAAGCVASLYRRFPAEATVFVVPVAGADEVVFGRVMSLAGGSVALLFGADAKPESARSDWVVVHELSHLGNVSFVGEGHWLEEGLATYYEPVLRERAGWMREEELWAHFVREMPRGVRQPGEPASLEEREGIDATYWGGALFALLADVRIRAATQGRTGLDDVMRAALDRLGNATRSARVEDFLAVGVQATGSSALRDTFRAVAVAGEPVDLASTWAALGVVPSSDGTVRLRDDAPLAAVRRAIATGGAH